MKTISFYFALLIISQSILFSQIGWFQQNSGTNRYLHSCYFLNDNTGYVVGTHGVVLKTTNGGSIWLNLFNQQNYDAVCVSFISADVGWVYIVNRLENDSTFILKTHDGGLTWNKYFVDTCEIFSGMADLQFVNTSIGYISNSFGLKKTSNGGINWNMSYTNQLAGLFFVDQNTGWTGGTYPGVYKTTDGGNDWILQQDPFIQNQWGVDFSFINSQTGFCIPKSFGYTGPIYSTTNGGNNWSRHFDLYSFRSIQFMNLYTGYCLAWNSNYYYINSIAKTTNNGSNWIIHYINSSHDISDHYFSSVNTGWVVGDSGTIMKTTTGGVTIGINPINTEIPNRFSLSQNYPNPFNPATVINFQVPTLNQVKLAVYDLLGKEIAELVNESLKYGVYEIEFNGSNQPSGIYFYRLQAGDYTETKKMVLLK